MVNSVKQWFYLLLEGWLSKSPQYYCTRTPIELSDNDPVKKNYIYWDRIAQVLQNKPFLNELDDRHQVIKDRIDRELLKTINEDSYNKIKVLRAELKGSRTMLGMLRDAHNNAIKEREKGT